MKIQTKGEKAYQAVLSVFMILIMVITVYPVYYSIINSLNTASDIEANGYALLWIRDFTFESWKTVLNDPEIISTIAVTVSRTVIVTFFQTIITAMFAYGYSKNNLSGKKFYTLIGFVSMYLSGGIIANFILFNVLGLYDSYWMYIIPCLFGGFYNAIIFVTNFRAIPESLLESARIDGASEYRIFFQIVLPLSRPVMTALGIFTAVATWNDYSATLYYTRSPAIQTLSYYTLSITKSAEAASNLSSSMAQGAASVMGSLTQAASNYKTIELACMVLAAIPLIVVYPFAQKYFEKGVMIGSVKG